MAEGMRYFEARKKSGRIEPDSKHSNIQATRIIKRTIEDVEVQPDHNPDSRIHRRQAMEVLDLAETTVLLRFIADPQQPEHEHGGFHDNTILAARSALHHLRHIRDRKI